MTAAQIVEARGGQNGMACCPAHDDKTPSMAVTEKDGKILVHCYAGCSQQAVIGALIDLGQWPESTPFEIEHPKRGKPDQSWPYHDSAGQVIGYACRFNTATGKDVLPYFKHPDGWKWKAPETPRPLYNLHKLRSDPDATVIIAEGEKAADAACRLFPDGYISITWQGGAKAVSRTDWGALKGRNVIIWPDADEPGRKAADELERLLNPLSCKVQRINPPDNVVAGWDADDALVEGWTQEQINKLIGTDKSPEPFILDLAEFLAMEFKPREMIIDPIFCTQGLFMVHAPRGLGKTYFDTSLAYAVVCGLPFLKWATPKPRGVLFLDGEMPAPALQERFAAVVAAADGVEPLAPLRIATPDIVGSLDLSRAEDQQKLTPYLDGVELIIVDSIATLCGDAPENEGASWMPLQQWALKMRASGRSVLFIHHDGKNGQQRGTSRREDVLDTVIGLKRPEGYNPAEGARFEIHFDKNRGFYGDDADAVEATLTTDERGRMQWIWRSLKQKTSESVLDLFRSGISQTEIARELKINKSTVCRHLKSAGLT